MQNWKELYTELAETLATKVPAIKWIDLWHNQVNFLTEEHPFPSPSLFLSFRILKTEDRGIKVQSVTLQIDTFIFYETFADTFRGSYNQDSALDFLDLINDTYAVLHGTSGDNYSEMRRIGFAPVDTGGAGNLYQQSFVCVLTDYAATKNYVDGEVDEVTLSNEVEPAPEPDAGEEYYVIN